MACGRGSVTMIVGDLCVTIPKSYTPRKSLGRRIHVCFRVYTPRPPSDIVPGFSNDRHPPESAARQIYVLVADSDTAVVVRLYGLEQ